MGMPCCPSAGLERDTRAARPSRIGRLEQRVDAYRAGEILVRPLAGRLRAVSFDVHVLYLFTRLPFLYLVALFTTSMGISSMVFPGPCSSSQIISLVALPDVSERTRLCQSHVFRFRLDPFPRNWTPSMLGFLLPERLKNGVT